MSEDVPEIRPLEPGLVDRAAALLAASFAGDPIYSKVFPDASRRERALRVFMGVPVRDAVRWGYVDAVAGSAGDLVGLAVWLPPRAYPWGVARQLRAIPSMLRLALIAPASMVSLMRFGANVDDAFPDAEAVWYLEAIGIRPDHQGRGLGSRLLRAGLERVDASGGACYLETPTEANVRLYRRHGFEVERANVELLPGGPTHWTMLRPGAV